MKNLVLIGLPGCGKSTVGKCLAAELGLSFFDCDAEIEAKIGKRVEEIFAKMEEKFFRDQESEILAQALSKPGKVIASGGGIVLRKENRELLKRATVVFLDRKVEEIMSTCDMAGRPLMKSCSLEELSAQRRQLYLDCADYVVTAEKPDEITAEIIGYWREGTCAF